MLRIDSANNITLTQGNSAEIDVTPLDADGEPIELQEGDKVIFKVMWRRRNRILKKELTAADWDSEEKALKLILTPEDTVYLPEGMYEFDCLYIFADGSAYTFIDAAQFKVVKAIAKVGDDP
ncbi:MAG: hypothetical protein K6F91_03715 [Ruminococcus sp.]|nr:hypothetical protein [Ruminococcus sp.]